MEIGEMSDAEATEGLRQVLQTNLYLLDLEPMSFALPGVERQPANGEGACLQEGPTANTSRGGFRHSRFVSKDDGSSTSILFDVPQSQDFGLGLVSLNQSFAGV